MSDYLEMIEQLREEGEAVGFGPTQVQLCEEAVHLADLHGDLDQGYATRMRLMMAATFGGRHDLLLVAFAWCLAQHDREPQRFPEHELLWRYKWVMGNLAHFPQVSRGQLEEMLADMEQRFQRAGSTLHAVHHKRRDVLRALGDFAGAARADEQMARTPRDRLSDCPACVVDSDVRYRVELGEDVRALERAEPILQGRLRCAEIPHQTYGHLLLPLVRLGRAPEGMAYHRKGYRLVAANPGFLDRQADHLVFLSLTDNLAKGVKLLERHLPQALTTPSLLRQLDFFLAARLLLACLADQGRKALRLRPPAAFPPHEPKGHYTVADLAGWFDNQLRELAARFDARNGNSYYAGRLAGLDGLKKWGTPCPLSAR